jgi:nucleoid-associated protein YgaU
VVEHGDNLTKIGQKYGLTWQQVFEANKDIISDPDLIHPGQELKIPTA